LNFISLQFYLWCSFTIIVRSDRRSEPVNIYTPLRGHGKMRHLPAPRQRRQHVVAFARSSYPASYACSFAAV